MKFALTLFLATSLTFLGACSQTVYTQECTWAEEIPFQPETKQWLEGLDWPPTAYEDFEQIADHNDLHERYCN